MTHRTLYVLALGITGMVHLARAVEPGLPSKTAVVTAVARAVATHDPDPSVRNPDWLAERLLGPVERRLVTGTPWANVLDQDYREAGKNPEVDVLVRVLLVRTRFIDEQLTKAVVSGVQQVVILGAGFDTRAYRLRDVLKQARVFEVDYGPTQEYKKRRIQQVFGCLPENVVYSPIDFTKERLGDVLTQAGYHRDERTFFIWEGVSYYLPGEVVLGTLRYVAAESAPGSAIVADFIAKSLIDKLGRQIDPAEPAMIRGALVQAKRMAELGEPWLFGIPDGKEREYLSGAGLQLTELLPLSGADALRRYRTRKDGSVVGNAPASNYSPGFLLEAAVPKR